MIFQFLPLSSFRSSSHPNASHSSRVISHIFQLLFRQFVTFSYVYKFGKSVKHEHIVYFKSALLLDSFVARMSNFRAHVLPLLLFSVDVWTISSLRNNSLFSNLSSLTNHIQSCQFNGNSESICELFTLQTFLWIASFHRSEAQFVEYLAISWMWQIDTMTTTHHCSKNVCSILLAMVVG